VYLHVPFCRDRCTYCAFPTVHDVPALHEPLVDALLARAAAYPLEGPLRTLYLGGGTPALLEPAALARLFAGLRRVWSFDLTIEITLESNPVNVTPESLLAWADLGVTRVSVGVQSFVDRALAHLARLHDGADARRALHLLASSWRGSFNADLLVGWSGQTPEALRADLDALLAFDPPHVSAYGLTVEPRTSLAVLQRLGRELVVPSALHPELDAVFAARLEQAGLQRYEVSNFARAGHASRHNQACWRNEDYLGLGPGAASSRHPLRWVEREDPRAWIEAARRGAGVRRACERIAPAQRLLENVSVGLRTRAGVGAGELDRRFGPAWRARLLPAAQPLRRAGVLAAGDSLRLPPAELVRADAVARALAPACLDDAPDAPVPAP
jgi:oxygen-independent coproporphyrinogen-3 oxidase